MHRRSPTKARKTETIDTSILARSVWQDFGNLKQIKWLILLEIKYSSGSQMVCNILTYVARFIRFMTHCVEQSAMSGKLSDASQR
jgi:hypothetical protein